MESFTATQLANNAGYIVDTALVSPVMITRHNRPCVVMLSATTYNALTAAAAGTSIPPEGSTGD